MGCRVTPAAHPTYTATHNGELLWFFRRRMLNISSPLLRTGLLALLLPVLLLLPTFHTHPEQQHAHGHDTTHSHAAIIHADFLAALFHDHDEHGSGHNAPDAHPSGSDSRTSLSTLLPRSFVLLGVALEHLPFAPPAALPVNPRHPPSVSGACQPDHPPPIASACFPASSPRSPPCHV